MGRNFGVLGYYDYSKLLKQEKIGKCFVVELREDPKAKRYAVDIVNLCENTRHHDTQTSFSDSAEYWFNRMVEYIKELCEKRRREEFNEENTYDNNYSYNDYRRRKRRNWNFA